MTATDPKTQHATAIITKVIRMLEAALVPGAAVKINKIQCDGPKEWSEIDFTALSLDLGGGVALTLHISEDTEVWKANLEKMKACL